MAEYQPIPVGTAVEIAERYAKSMVVILAYDPAFGLTHTTTYGVAPEDKERAADVGEQCARLICGEGFEQRRTYEDYRFVDQGRRAEMLRSLVKACTAAEHALRSLLATREGISDELLQQVADTCKAAIADGQDDLTKAR